MIKDLKSILQQHFHLTVIPIMIPYLFTQTTASVLFYTYLDTIILLYLTQYPLITQIDTTKKRPLLSIDTTREPEKSSPPAVATSVIRRKIRHNTISSTYDHDYYHSDSPCADMPQLLFSPTSSVSSSSSSCSSATTDYMKRSKVEVMVYLFENGCPHLTQTRRNSVDSHLYNGNNKKSYIRERKFEYHPTVGEWKKRINGNIPLRPSESKSTPVYTKCKMPPIPEASRSAMV